MMAASEPVPAGAVAALKKEDAKKTGGGFDLQGRPMYTKRTLSFPFRFSFSHMGRLVRTGYSRRLEPADLYIEPELDTVKLEAAFSANWAYQKSLPAGPSLWQALSPGAGRVIGITAVMHAIGLACTFAQPLILQQIVDALSCQALGGGGSCPTATSLYPYAGYLAASTVVYNILSSHERIMLTLLGLRCRASIMAAIYRKTLCLSSGAVQEESAGRIVTLMSNDAQKLQEFFPMIHEIWAAPALVAASIYLLYSVLEWSTFVGFAVMLFVVPLTGVTAGRLFKLRRGLVGLADKRVNLVSECINGIRVLKFYAWERNFAERITAIRADELGELWKINKLSALFSVLLFSAPVLIAVAAIGSYSLTGAPLTASRLYTALSVFNIIRFPLVFLPFILISVLNAKVALERLTVFLLAEEAEDARSGDDAATKPGAIRVSGGTFHYAEAPPKKEDPAAAKARLATEAAAAKAAAKAGRAGRGLFGSRGAAGAALNGKAGHDDGAASSKATFNPLHAVSASATPPSSPRGAAVTAVAVDVDGSPPAFTLSGVELDIQPGQLVMVIGPVGSGKSTLLAALNRYLVRDAGSVAVGGSVAYVAQTAWILGATVEANILFGTPKDEARYQAALSVSQLRPDLAMLPFGDQTEIGERGVTLSGGQKQRVSLARLVYARADVNLLDDPLSAVDAHVGAALFEQCLCGSLAGKTRVLVTNALQYLPAADLIVVMEHGVVRETGTFEQLRAKGTDFDALCETHEIEAEDDEPQAANGAASGFGTDAPPPPPSSKKKQSSDGGRRRGSKDGPPRPPPAPKPAMGNLTGTESRAEGKVSAAVYAAYMGAARSKLLVAGVFLGFCCEYGTKSFLDSWLTFWTGDTIGWTKQGRTHYYLVVYVALFLANAGATYGRSILFYIFAIRASRNMHAGMLGKVLRLPQSFFDTTPSGRVINRFSRDTEVLDTLLPTSLVQAIGCFFSILTSLLIVTIASIYFLAVLVPVIAAYLVLQRFYIPACVELQRIESTTRSPIYTNLGEAVAGVATIRAYGRGSYFIDASDVHIYANGNAIMTQRQAAEWLNIRLRFLSAIVSTMAALLVISGGVAPGLAGLTLVYALQVPQYMEHGTAQASDAESKMNSVERVTEYLATPSEADEETPREHAGAVPSGWPRAGGLDVDKLVLRYRPDLPPVLRGVSFAVAPGEKVGIVGRTGSGKSSLFLALFRMVEPEGGAIRLDGVDTSKLGLRPLRRALAMIPQDPFMYSGTVRSNLDPFRESTDSAMWESLDRVGLKPVVEADAKKLEMEVVDGGSNFSLGQRQLLCMARALLRPGLKYLLLDEATASVDLDSDLLIQKTVTECFSGVTTLTIAHRLNTIMGSDKILVLDGGEVAEFGPPEELLANPNGAFSALVAQTGPKNAAHLRAMSQRFAAAARGGAAHAEGEEPAAADSVAALREKTRHLGGAGHE